MEMNEQKRNLIMYLALTAVPLLYILILVSVISTDDTLTYATDEFYIALIGTFISAPSMAFMSVRAYLKNLDRPKVVVYMGVLNIPSFIGLIVWMLMTYGIGGMI